MKPDINCNHIWKNYLIEGEPNAHCEKCGVYAYGDKTMKPDSVARFEAMLKRAKQIPYSGRPEHKGLVLKDELIAVLEAGLVSTETNKSDDSPAPTKPCGCLVGHKCAADTKDTIEIDRAVAEEWTNLVHADINAYSEQDKSLLLEIQKALSEGRSK